MSCGIRGLILDLDGVLVDSLAAIGGSINHALEVMERPQLHPDELRKMIGPPIEEMAAAVLGMAKPKTVDRFVEIYRERYGRVCTSQSVPIPGVAETLARLSARWPLAVATSKPQIYADAILEKLGVASCFRSVEGRDFSLDHTSKADLIGRAISRLGGGGDVRGVVMVGDRCYDVEGARAHGLPTVAVLSGMGEEAELRAAGARWIVPELADVFDLLDAVDRARGWTVEPTR